MEVILRFPVVEALSPPILQLSEVTFSYDSKRTIFSNVNLNATLESRICIVSIRINISIKMLMKRHMNLSYSDLFVSQVGDNGAGKTTLLKIIMGILSPTRGDRITHRNLKFGYFSQHHVDQLDMNLCSVELLQQAYPGSILLCHFASYLLL